MCIIFGDVNQFIGHCLIPLDTLIKKKQSKFTKVPKVVKTTNKKTLGTSVINSPLSPLSLWYKCKERGDNGLFIALVPKVLTFSYSLAQQLWGPSYWFSIQTFQPLIVVYIRGNFVNHNWGCT